MLTAEENELLTRVGPGTPMGNVLRQYWLPCLLSSELPVPDGVPVRIRMLGEDLVAFRDSQGQVGLLDIHCAHRGASLFFGRNEECGLRCVYHGWKFDVAGRCVDMPNEPPESTFKDKIRLTAYRCRERNGVIWAYFGPTQPPELPSVEWNLVPPQQVHASKRLQESNWVQALEGGIDPSHSGFLHASLGPAAKPKTVRDAVRILDRRPRYELLATDYGMRIGTRRDVGEAHHFWSITHFLMPCYNVFSSENSSYPSAGSFAWVPMDDVTTMVWCFTWNPARRLTDDEINETRARERVMGGVHTGSDELLPADSRPGGAWRATANSGNDYLFDRDAQRTRRYSGLPGISMQDAAIQESMGAIYDRGQEHLGSSDSAIIQVRRIWLKAARELQDKGLTPLGVATPEAYVARPAGLLLRSDEDWTQAGNDWITGAPGATMPQLDEAAAGQIMRALG